MFMLFLSKGMDASLQCRKAPDLNKNIDWKYKNIYYADATTTN